MKQPAAPFTCTFTPNLPELLWALECSLTITTYQAGKLVILSAPSPNDLKQLPRTFQKPMGVAIKDGKMAVATKNEVVVYRDSPSHAATYPDAPNTYDHLFVPRATYYTGDIDTHDLYWDDKGLLAVNTRFCCLARINDDYSFEPIWRPKFITELVPEDRCHLNGLAMENGKPKYLSALSATNTPQGWREHKKDGGIILDFESGEIVAQGLAMPHSPRIYNGKLYTLLSATGQLVCIDPQTGKYDVVNEFNGFVRGMAQCGDYLLIGLSKIREKSSSFADLPISKKSLIAGISVVHLPTGAITSQIRYEASVEEIYDVQVLPNMRRPGIVSMEKDTFRRALVTPETTFWGLTKEEADSHSL
jgi:uncharacterized protein (TIGR03032 family)